MNYQLLDSGDGRRLEKFGDYILDRPDPQIIWKKTLEEAEWEKSNAYFSDKWINKNVPDKWILEHNGVKCFAKLAPFKHTGIFPEQSLQWDYINNSIKSLKTIKQINMLNLFGYTGIATLFAAKAGARVTHVDASRPAITWANENRDLNEMQKLPIRWIIDDALKFTERDIKRGIKYDAILMDPPVYGHGPTGSVWDFNKDFPLLLENCKKILSSNPLFVLVNAYAISSSSTTLGNALYSEFGNLGGKVENGELTLKEKTEGRLLSTGIWARWSKETKI